MENTEIQTNEPPPIEFARNIRGMKIWSGIMVLSGFAGLFFYSQKFDPVWWVAAGGCFLFFGFLAIGIVHFRLVPAGIESVSFHVGIPLFRRFIYKEEFKSVGVRSVNLKFQLCLLLHNGTLIPLPTEYLLPRAIALAVMLLARKYGLPVEKLPDPDDFSENNPAVLHEFLESRPWCANIWPRSLLWLNRIRLYENANAGHLISQDENDEGPEHDLPQTPPDEHRGEIRILKDGFGKRAEISADWRATKDFEPHWVLTAGAWGTINVKYRDQPLEPITSKASQTVLNQRWQAPDGVVWFSEILLAIEEGDIWIMRCRRTDGRAGKCVAVLSGSEHALQADVIDETAWTWIRLSLAAFWITNEPGQVGRDS